MASLFDSDTVSVFPVTRTLQLALSVQKALQGLLVAHKGKQESLHLKLFSFKKQVDNFGSHVTFEVTILVKAFSDKSNQRKNRRFPIEEGISPVIWFLLSFKFTKSFGSPIKLGIDPLIWFSDKSRTTRFLRNEIDDGIDPVSRFEPTFNC